MQSLVLLVLALLLCTHGAHVRRVVLRHTCDGSFSALLMAPPRSFRAHLEFAQSDTGTMMRAEGSATKSIGLIGAVILLPLADAFSSLAPPSCARRPFGAARMLSGRLRPRTSLRPPPSSSVRMMSASGDSMTASSEALLAAADHIVAAAAILGENQCDEDDPASLSAGGCSIANAGRDCAIVAQALGRGLWKDGATESLGAMAGSFFVAAASLDNVLSVGAALGEAGIEIEDGSKLMPAEAGLSLIGAGLTNLLFGLYHLRATKERIDSLKPDISSKGSAP